MSRFGLVTLRAHRRLLSRSVGKKNLENATRAPLWGKLAPSTVQDMVVPHRGKRVSVPVVQMQVERFDELCARKDAKNEIARSELIGTTRRSLFRWREGTVTPNLEAALTTARRLETTVEDLWHLREDES